MSIRKIIVLAAGLGVLSCNMWADQCQVLCLEEAAACETAVGVVYGVCWGWAEVAHAIADTACDAQWNNNNFTWDQYSACYDNADWELSTALDDCNNTALTGSATCAFYG